MAPTEMIFTNEADKQRVVCVLCVIIHSVIRNVATTNNMDSCSASEGSTREHIEAARSVARTLHEGNAMLVYGGSRVGLMEEIARTLVTLSGPPSVLRIIPKPLKALGKDILAIRPRQVLTIMCTVASES